MLSGPSMKSWPMRPSPQPVLPNHKPPLVCAQRQVLRQHHVQLLHPRPLPHPSQLHQCQLPQHPHQACHSQPHRSQRTAQLASATALFNQYLQASRPHHLLPAWMKNSDGSTHRLCQRQLLQHRSSMPSQLRRLCQLLVSVLKRPRLHHCHQHLARSHQARSFCYTSS